MQPITIRYPVRPAERSLATAAVCDLFGLAPVEPPLVLVENFAFELRPGDVVLFAGPSGSGKSSLLRAVAAQVAAVDALALDLPDRPLVDALPGTLPERLDALAACGLSEARLLLRRPSELSDGQRYRFRLALAIALVSARRPAYVVADEFGAILDRTLAQVVAFNLRKLCDRSGVGALVATTHDDVIADLNPNVCVQADGNGGVTVERRDVKKNGSTSTHSYGSPKVPEPIGRTSLGGIIAAITSPTPAAS